MFARNEKKKRTLWSVFRAFLSDNKPLNFMLVLREANINEKWCLKSVTLMCRLKLPAERELRQLILLYFEIMKYLVARRKWDFCISMRNDFPEFFLGHNASRRRQPLMSLQLVDENSAKRKKFIFLRLGCVGIIHHWEASRRCHKQQQNHF